MSAAPVSEQRKVRTPQGGILPNGKPQQCGAAPQKQTARRAPFLLPLRDRSFLCRARVKWRCKRPPEALVTGLDGNALSGAMPNREATKRGPRGYGFRVGSLRPSVRAVPEEWTSARERSRATESGLSFSRGFFSSEPPLSLTPKQLADNPFTSHCPNGK